MTAVRDHDGPGMVLPEKPSRDEPNAQSAQRAREEGAPAGPGWALRLAWAQRLFGTVLTGEAMVHRQPPSIAQVWERHMASARHYNAGLLRGPRYLWALAHTPVAAAAYLLAWLTSSVPLLVITALTLYLIHLFA
jgi:hypothetical protein